MKKACLVISLTGFSVSKACGAVPSGKIVLMFVSPSLLWPKIWMAGGDQSKVGAKQPCDQAHVLAWEFLIRRSNSEHGSRSTRDSAFSPFNASNAIKNFPAGKDGKSV
jgi:hypothetical protein